ncbi:MGH1-like glycoside hydrolase domain-containing protein [Hymenobacter arizonensis]|uniref:Glycosyl hydrolase family 63 C-terminal domain-containing protein n=1 Tax=Hymenobacter arizonensis TaxID=1227077 RepID=A0A1I5ZYD3_HYMAR|nr:glucosidase [Hymenobacter arizonensis]SFQ61400.1 Glycosyl hydrolase family 63 C-terminal domain-containing protein [Hymenobacter arizonensis]
MTQEQLRLAEDHAQTAAWKKFGPYLTERQWGTVREDYSADGNAWDYITHDLARSYAYRWGEEGIGGISDARQRLCFSVALWNGKDEQLKERLFGLTNGEGNHGEDVKEQYYYLDSTPTHSYMKLLYKYPQQAFPYEQLRTENARRTREDPEFELLDTGIFDENRYFDVFVEYAKAGPEDLLIQITVQNRGPEAATVHVLPQAWYRNTWAWGYENYRHRPQMQSVHSGVVEMAHQEMGEYRLYCDQTLPGTAPDLLFCDNDTNGVRLYDLPREGRYFKDGINDYLVKGQRQAINPAQRGTKVAAHYPLTVPARGSQTVRVRLSHAAHAHTAPFADFAEVMAQRQQDADEFYHCLQEHLPSPDARNVQRQAFAGMLWSKQYYYYDMAQWLDGDPDFVAPPSERRQGRNSEWRHLYNADIISMPDKWEYPWYAAWDLAFHCLPLAMVDPEFAKSQLRLLTRDWYMHPNGQLPAYEWNLNDANPPVHAWATWRVYQMDQKLNNGKGDLHFLESVFHKLNLNFAWWVNRKDRNGRNIFEGGFLGLDNIGVFDRSSPLPTGGFIEQSDGTSWMAMYALNLMRMALELARTNPVYQEIAGKFFEHFLYIVEAMTKGGDGSFNLWDEEDEFYYDVLHTPDGTRTKLKVRSIVGLIPLFAVEVLDEEILDALPEFTQRLRWLLDHRPHLAALVSRWQAPGEGERHRLSLLRRHRLTCLLSRMLDEKEFLSPYGIRALSRYHHEHPYRFPSDEADFSVAYVPGESDSGMFGGNSNWRGPIWFPINYLIIESLQRFYAYYGDSFQVEHPTGSGQLCTLQEIAADLAARLSKLFLRGADGKRPAFGTDERLQTDPHFRDYLLFHEYFHGEDGRGLGASHQTGWTGLLVRLFPQP